MLQEALEILGDLSWWDWSALGLALAATLYLALARNPFLKGMREHSALRLARIGLCLALWSIGLGLIGVELALAALVLAIIVMVKGRALYGLAIIAIALISPFAGGISFTYKAIQHLQRESVVVEEANPAAAEARSHSASLQLMKYQPFTVILADPGPQRSLKLGLAVSADDAVALSRLKALGDQVRGEAQALISRKTQAQIATAAGKIALQRELAELLNAHLKGDGKVRQVMFTEFTVQ